MNAWTNEPGDEDTLWREALDMASALEEPFDGLELAQDHEWLRYVLGRDVADLRAAVRHGIATKLEAHAQGGPERRSELMVAADSVRGSAVFATYCLDFMRSQQ